MTKRRSKKSKSNFSDDQYVKSVNDDPSQLSNLKEGQEVLIRKHPMKPGLIRVTAHLVDEMLYLRHEQSKSFVRVKVATKSYLAGSSLCLPRHWAELIAFGNYHMTNDTQALATAVDSLIQESLGGLLDQDGSDVTTPALDVTADNSHSATPAN
jgi:hypothetical protein